MSLQKAILGLLLHKPMTGYDLKTVFNKSVNFVWAAHLSQIYRDLGTLEEKKLVSSHIEQQDDKPDRRVYTITEEGKKDFEEWLNRFPTVLTPPERDEFLLRMFFGSMIPHEELIFQLQRFIREKKDEIDAFKGVEEIFEEYSKTINRPDEKFYWKLIIRGGYLRNEALIKWAEECISELKQHSGTNLK